MWTRRGCLCLLAGLGAGCGNPQPHITAVTPRQAYPGDTVTLAILGERFLPAAVLDPDQGRRIAVSDGFQVRIGDGVGWAQLTDVTWESPDQLTARLPGAATKDFPPKLFDVELVDPRGQHADLSEGFEMLAPNRTPPNIELDSPGLDAVYLPGSLLRGSFQATAVAPARLSGLRWAYYEGDSTARVAGSICYLPPSAIRGTCSFQVMINSNLVEDDTVTVVAYADDDTDPPNTREEPRVIRLHGAPKVSAISPSHGGILGGTDVVITGSGFVPGTQAAIDGVLLSPNGGIVVDAHTLSGHVPPHKEGDTSVRVQTPLLLASGEIIFTYQAGPQIDAIVPDTGSTVEETPVAVAGKSFTQQTQILFGITLEQAVPLAPPLAHTPTSITGRAPRGVGSATVWAFDPELGFTKLENRFTWRAP
jgi:hypothetical protein